MSDESGKKERTTVTVDPAVKTFLTEDGRNASETVNKLVKMEMGKDAFNEEYLRSRMEEHEDKYHEAANKAKRHLKRYNQIKDRLEQSEDKVLSVANDLEDDLLNGVPMYPTYIQNNADVSTSVAKSVHQRLQERNDELPEEAFQEPGQYEPVDWRER